MEKFSLHKNNCMQCHLTIILYLVILLVLAIKKNSKLTKK